MEMETLSELQDYALLNKGLSLLNDIYISNKNGNTTPLNDDQIQEIEYFIQKYQLEIATKLQANTEKLL